MSPVSFNSVAELRAHVGQEIGVSEWRLVDQAMIDAFAAATGDDQWIHVDPQRAAASPFGSTIAHGLLTLSLGPAMLYELLPVEGIEGITFGLNYGYDKVRFVSPLPSGTRLRLRLTLAGVEEVTGGLQLRLTQSFEAEGQERPVCVAEQLSRLVLSES